MLEEEDDQSSYDSNKSAQKLKQRVMEIVQANS